MHIRHPHPVPTSTELRGATVTRPTTPVVAVTEQQVRRSTPPVDAGWPVRWS